MRVLLCGGGTAGHVMPAVAIAEIIEKNFKNATVAFCGRQDGDENKVYTRTGHKLYTVDIRGISRSLTINNIKSIFKIIKSSRTARNIIQEFKPDLIIGTGGYVCYPFIRQGQRLKIKTVIHESNVYPGLVTRILGGRCEKLLLNLEGTKQYLKKTDNTEVVGNPTRSEFGVHTRSEARKRLGIGSKETLIVSFGGSLGAEMLNKTVMEYISRYVVNDESIVYIHSTGRSNYEMIRKNHPELFVSIKNVKILPYIDNMPTLLTAADLAITRCGAITISELCCSGTPSILIPSPNVTANHQYVNAKYMKDVGAAELIEEKDLTCDKLHDTVREILNDPKKTKKMRNKSHSLYEKNTGEIIAKVLKELARDK